MRTPPPYEPDPWPQIVRFLAWAVPSVVAAVVLMFYFAAYAHSYHPGWIWLTDASKQDSILLDSILTQNQVPLALRHSRANPYAPESGVEIRFTYTTAAKECPTPQIKAAHEQMKSLWGARVKDNLYC